MGDDFVCIEDAAWHMGLSSASIYHAIRNNRIPYCRRPSGMVVSLFEVERYHKTRYKRHTRYFIGSTELPDCREYYTGSEAAVILGVSRDVIYRAIKLGQLVPKEPDKSTGKSSVLISRMELHRFSKGLLRKRAFIQKRKQRKQEKKAKDEGVFISRKKGWIEGLKTAYKRTKDCCL